MFEFISIGQILKPYRHTGELLADINPDVYRDLEKCKALFIQIDGIEIPFFIEALDLSPDVCHIKLEEFHAPEDIKPFNGSKLYLRLSDLSNPDVLQPKDDPFEKLKGFQLKNNATGQIYTILSTEEYPQQWMAIVKADKKEVLVPLAEDWIVSIDFENKIVEMDLPDGLI